MARMLLDRLGPGMRLEKPVFNLHGVLLLKTGEILTAKHLEMFKAWGIREADVMNADGVQPELAPEAELSPDAHAAVQAAVALRFRRSEPKGDPVVAEILRVVTRQLTRRMAAQRRA
jgi:hypothetical protein